MLLHSTISEAASEVKRSVTVAMAIYSDCIARLLGLSVADANISFQSVNTNTCIVYQQLKMTSYYVPIRTLSIYPNGEVCRNRRGKAVNNVSEIFGGIFGESNGDVNSILIYKVFQGDIML